MFGLSTMHRGIIMRGSAVCAIVGADGGFVHSLTPPPCGLTRSTRRSLSCANSDSSDRSKDRSTPLPYQPKTITQVSLPLSGSPASSRAACLAVSGGQHSIESCIGESSTSRSEHGQGRRAELSAGKERQAGRRGKVSTPNLVTKQNQSCNPADKKGRKAAAPQASHRQTTSKQSTIYV